MSVFDGKYSKWKKDVAYLEDIHAYDLSNAGMVSIFSDVLLDEGRKEITAMYNTIGNEGL